MTNKKKKVLIVEDDKMIVEMYKLRLEGEGYEVLTTDRGTEALQLAKEQQPALVLLDIILPEIDGFTILQNLKADSATRDIPVIMLTNLAQESDKQKGQELGAIEYFVKSQHTPAEIFELINNYIKK